MSAEDFMLPCLNKKLFGIECFGCGAQRALWMVVNGDFAGAFHLFPAIYTIILFVFTCGLHFIDKKRSYGKLITFLAIINAVIIVFSYFYRNFCPVAN